jgi:hypothetical protein
MKNLVQNPRNSNAHRSASAPGAICATLNRMVGDLQSFLDGPSKERSFCTMSRRAEIAVLSINPVFSDAMYVSLQKWDAQRSAYKDQLACYVRTTGPKVRDVMGADGKPASHALRKKLGRALSFAARQFENGIFAG